MELSHPHPTSATTIMETNTTNSTVSTLQSFGQTVKETNSASNTSMDTNKETMPAICDDLHPNTTITPLNNNNNSTLSLDEKSSHQNQFKQSSSHNAELSDHGVTHSMLENIKESSKEEGKTSPAIEKTSVDTPNLEQPSSIKVKRCKHGRIIIRDMSKKKSALSNDHSSINVDSNHDHPPGITVDTFPKETIQITVFEEPPRADPKSSSSDKPSLDCERLAGQDTPKLSLNQSSTTREATAKSTTTHPDNLPSSNLNSESKGNSNNETKSKKSTNEKRHSRRHRESRRHRRRDRSPTRSSPRRCSVVRNKSHSQSPSHRKSPRRYRSTSSRERSRERHRHSSYRRRRSRSPYRESRDYRRAGSRKNIKLRSPRRHLSPISPPPRHHHEHLPSRRRSPTRRHSRSSGSKSMSTSRSRSRSSSRSRSRTKIQLSTLVGTNKTHNQSSPKKDLPRESLDKRIDNLFNDSGIRKEDSFSNRTIESISTSNSQFDSSLQKSPKKSIAKNDYSDNSDNSPPSDVYDPEGPISPISSAPSPSGSIKKPASNKQAYVPEKDVIPSSAVSLNQHEKYLQKKTRQERIVEEVKIALKPFYQRRAITKEQYKDVSRRAVPKICHSKNGEINPVKIRSLIHAYVKKLTHHQ